MEGTHEYPLESVAESQLPSPTPFIDLDEPKLPAFPSSSSLHVSIDCCCDACLADASDAFDRDARGRSKKKSSQQRLRERYENGDPEVGLLGESSGKFDFYVLYSRSLPSYQSGNLALSEQLFADVPSFESNPLPETDIIPLMDIDPMNIINIETSENSIERKTSIPPARIPPSSKNIRKGRRCSRRRRSLASISRLTRFDHPNYSPQQSLSSPTSHSEELAIPIDWDLEDNPYKQRLARFETFGQLGSARVLVLITNFARENYISRSLATRLSIRPFLLTTPIFSSAPLYEDQHKPLTHDCVFNLNIDLSANGESYCDLIHAVIGPLDTYDVILGRAWQYDREVMYNGRHNTMSFWMGNRHITLYPFDPP